MDGESSFVAVKFSYKGKSVLVDDDVVDLRRTTASELLSRARNSFNVDDDVVLRLIFKGKTIARDDSNSMLHDDAAAAGDDASSANDNDANGGDSSDRPAFPEGTKAPKGKGGAGGALKVIVMGSAATGIRKLNSLRSDPLMRGFDDDEKKSSSSSASLLSTHWGPLHGNQHPQYKFCRFQECTDASFGTRPDESTPHAFRARELLERLATDPGMVSILESRELVVGTLGEIDPIDDRLMRQKASEGACLLGYNTNMGMRIDVKLRTDDLSGFRPYDELAATLIHELSHNWVGEHDATFWTNYGQMRVEYLWAHARLMRGGVFVWGKRTAALAGVTGMIIGGDDGERGGNNNNGAVVVARNGLNETSTTATTTIMDNICRSVIRELAGEMAQHRLPVQLVAPAIVRFGRELMEETAREDGNDGDFGAGGGHRLGTATTTGGSSSSGGNFGDGSTTGGTSSARERALAAAERRAREAFEKKSD